MKLFSIFAVFAFIFINVTYAQTQISTQKHSLFSGTFNIAVEGGATYSRTDYSGTGIDYIGRTSIEYTFPSNSISTIGLKLFGGGGYLSGEDPKKNPSYFRTEMYSFGGGLVYMVSVENNFFPYLFAGISLVNFNPQGKNGAKLPNNLADKYNRSELDYNIEFGVKIRATTNLNIIFNGGLQLSPKDNLDDITSGSAKDMFFVSTIGLGYSFGGYQDLDEDGIEDSKDLCPETAPGIQVDETGCAIDNDGDGIPDYLDKCLNTAKGIKVDSNGCPLDSDDDGVPDYNDLCPKTPRSIDIDEYGCPFDHDADGVPDYMDKCDNTPAKSEVDETGCPLDSDKDGIPDYLDKCPDSPAGAVIDGTGCSKENKENKSVVWERTPVILNASATFKSGRTDLLPSSYPELNKLLKVMRTFPNSRWVVEGYTDNTGSYEINTEISLKRAESVVDYFFKKGIAKTRFTVVGKGESNPVADNNTESGRAKNRRVVIIRVK